MIKDCQKRKFHAKFPRPWYRLEGNTGKGRLQVKRVLKQCVIFQRVEGGAFKICQRVKGNAFKMPKMPPWPKERVTKALQFEYTGLDRSMSNGIIITLNRLMVSVFIRKYGCVCLLAW